MKAAIAVLFLVFAVKPALAHHAFAAEFDAKKPVKLRGGFVPTAEDIEAAIDWGRE